MSDKVLDKDIMGTRTMRLRVQYESRHYKVKACGYRIIVDAYDLARCYPRFVVKLCSAIISIDLLASYKRRHLYHAMIQTCSW